jgi:hypothetical protein
LGNLLAVGRIIPATNGAVIHFPASELLTGPFLEANLE